jgi:3-phytase
MNKLKVVLFSIVILVSCKDKLAPIAKDAIQPKIITEKTPHDTDDPAIWIHPTNASNSLIIGTDKDSNGGLYLYDLNGKIIKKSIPLKRPNNVDVAYKLKVGNTTLDIAVTTERETNKIRIFSLPN